MGHIRRVMSIGSLALAVMSPTVAPAQQLTDQWQFRGSIYGWLPDVGGKTTFPAGAGSSVGVDSSSILDALEFAFMGTLEAQKGRWGVFTDVIYLNLGESKSQTRDLTIGGVDLPAGVTGDVSLDLKAWLWTLAGSYRVVTQPTHTLDVLAGARMVDIRQKLDWQFSADIGGTQPPPRSGSSDVDFRNWDAIIGVKGRLAFGANREWFIPYYLDVGSGDSDLTWQGVTGIGYAFRWGEAFFVWRYLDYQFSSERIEEVDFNGPAIGVAFRW